PASPRLDRCRPSPPHRVRHPSAGVPAARARPRRTDRWCLVVSWCAGPWGGVLALPSLCPCLGCACLGCACLGCLAEVVKVGACRGSGSGDGEAHDVSGEHAPEENAVAALAESGVDPTSEPG